MWVWFPMARLHGLPFTVVLLLVTSIRNFGAIHVGSRDSTAHTLGNTSYYPIYRGGGTTCACISTL